MYNGKKVSLVFPTYNEEKNIAQAIDDFQKLHIIDEIIIVDNNSKDATAIIAKKKKVTVITEKRQGYGYALQKGMKEASGDYIMLCEPDNTFLAKDALRLLKQMSTNDMIVGTRTNPRYIEKGANMHFLLRMGNISLAKIISLLYNPRIYLTDCGCTFRVMKKAVCKKILPLLTVGGSHFLSELIAVTLISGNKVLEIPVHYRKRVGESKITGSMRKAIVVGLKMFQVVALKRIKGINSH